MPSGADTAGPAPQRPLSRLARAVFARHPQGAALTARGRGGATLLVGSGCAFLGAPWGADGGTNAETGRRAQQRGSGFALKREHGALPPGARARSSGGLGALPHDPDAAWHPSARRGRGTDGARGGPLPQAPAGRRMSCRCHAPSTPRERVRRGPR